MPVITAFERSPHRGRGLARDMRGRWALEEAEQPYRYPNLWRLRRSGPPVSRAAGRK
ncbi:hypothetical protein [Lysobacter sp. D1-1-M9]|uniref:hypothetical protein n=1 Tax=Novilysobacter longmucuonensis TaxID=3098603 RepID=UPI003983C5F6